MTTVAAGVIRPDLRAVFQGRRVAGVVAAADRHGALTWVLPGPEPLTIRMAIERDAARAVEREAQMLVELRRRTLGELAATVPRHVGVRQWGEFPAALSSTVPGAPVILPDRHHPARRARVRACLVMAGRWLADLQEATGTQETRTVWGQEVLAAFDAWRPAWPGAGAVRRTLELAAERIDACRLPGAVVHGDFRPTNLRVAGGRVTGVVGWADGQAEGCPLRDAVRMLLTSSGAAPQRATVPALFLGRGWYPHLARSEMRAVLERLGAPAELWYPAVLLGSAELAMSSATQDEAEAHLAALGGAPPIGVVLNHQFG